MTNVNIMRMSLFIVTLYNPKTHEVVGYRYFGLPTPPKK